MNMSRIGEAKGQIYIGDAFENKNVLRLLDYSLLQMFVRRF